MNCFRKMASELFAAMGHQGSVHISFWGKKTYGDLFEKNGRGWIRPRKVARLFSKKTRRKLALPEDDPAATENILCGEYTKYRDAGFFSRLWMRMTNPGRIDIYRKVYTIVSLRRLHGIYRKMGIDAEHVSQSGDPAEWTRFFDRALSSVGKYLATMLSCEVGFFTEIFGSRKMNSHARAFQEFRKEITTDLRNAIHKSYIELARKISECASLDEEQWRKEISSWYDDHENSITQHGRNIDQKTLTGLRDTLRNKYGLLTCMVETTKEKPRENLLPEICGIVDKEHEDLSEQLINLDDGCSVYIENPDRRDCTILCNHRYVLQKGLFIRWKLSYRETPQSEEAEIVLDNIPGLAQALFKSPLNENLVRQIIIDYHRQDIQKLDPAALYHDRVMNGIALADKTAKILLQKCSDHLESRLLNGNQSITPESDMRIYARQLHACFTYLEKRKTGYIERCINLKKKALLYKGLSDNIAGEAIAGRILCLKELLGYPSDNRKTPEEIMEGLRESYRALSNTQEFRDLYGMAREYAEKLTYQAETHITYIRALANTFKNTGKPEGIHDLQNIFDYFSVTPRWEIKIQGHFMKAYQSMEKTDYPSARDKLSDTARKLFLEQAGNLSCSVAQLHEIHHCIERTRKKYQQELLKENRAIVISPQKISKRWSPYTSITNVFKTHDIEYIIPASLTMFSEELKVPRKSRQCAWLKMSAEPDKSTLKSLPVCFTPAYVYVEKEKLRTLYYLDKDVSLIEKIELRLDKNESQTFNTYLGSQVSGTFLSDKQLLLITELTNHCHDRLISRYCALMVLLPMSVEAIMWNGCARDTIVTDNRCGFIWSRNKPELGEAEKLFHSHFIYTPDKELYYYSRLENTLKQFRFLSENQQVFDEKFPHKKEYIESIPYWELEFIQSIVNLTRYEDRKLSGEKIFDMTRNEISRVFREISFLYHSDRNENHEGWQAFLAQKNEEARQALDNQIQLQQELIDNFGHLNNNDMASEIRYYVPAWLRPRHRTVDYLAIKYCKFLHENIDIRVSDLEYGEYENQEFSYGDDWEKIKLEEREQEQEQERLIRERDGMDWNELAKEIRLVITEYENNLKERNLRLACDNVQKRSENSFDKYQATSKDVFFSQEKNNNNPDKIIPSPKNNFFNF